MSHICWIKSEWNPGIFPDNSGEIKRRKRKKIKALKAFQLIKTRRTMIQKHPSISWDFFLNFCWGVLKEDDEQKLDLKGWVFCLRNCVAAVIHGYIYHMDFRTSAVGCSVGSPKRSPSWSQKCFFMAWAKYGNMHALLSFNEQKQLWNLMSAKTILQT